MKQQNVLFFFTTSSHYWSKGDSFHKAFLNLKEFTSRPCECLVYITTDEGAYIDQISGGLCRKTDEFTQMVGRFKFSQGRLTPIAEELKK